MHRRPKPKSKCKCTCCGGSKLRRCTRIMILLILLICLMVLPWAYIFFTLQTPSFSLKSEALSKIVINNCQMMFTQDSSIDILSPEISIKAPSELVGGKIYVEESKTTSVLYVNNTLSYHNSCIMTAAYHPNTEWGDLQIQCVSGQCNIIQQSTNALDFGNLVISGTQVNLNFLSVDAKKLDLQMEKGTLTLNRAVVHSDSIVSTKDGDVIFQSDSDFRSFWENQNSFFCLGSSGSINQVTPPKECWINEDSKVEAQKYSSQVAGNCTASYSFCSTAGPCPPTSPKVTMSSSHGSIYANFIDATEDSFLSPDSKLVASGPFKLQKIGLENNFNETVYTMNDKFKDRSKADHMALLTIGNYQGRSSSASKIAISPNPAYVDMRPWWLSVFSGSLLLGFPLQGNGRLMPGFCPYRTTLNTTQVHEMNQQFHNIFNQPNQVIYIENQDVAPMEQNFRKDEGLLTSGGNDKWISVAVNDDGDLSIKHRVITDNGVLFVAVIVSLLLSGILSIIGLVAVIFALHHAFTLFSKDSKHIKKYAVKYHNDKLVPKQDGSSGGGGGQLLRQQQQQQQQKRLQEMEIKRKQTSSQISGLLKKKKVHKKAKGKSGLNESLLNDQQNSHLLIRLSDEADQNKTQTKKTNIVTQTPLTFSQKLLSTIKNLPPPFALIDHLIFLMGRNITNSIIQFYQVVFTEIREEDLQESRNSIAMTEFKLRYEKFCFLKHYEERRLTTEKNAQLLKKYGFELQKKKDNMTEVYKKIRFLSEEEEKTKKQHSAQKIASLSVGGSKRSKSSAQSANIDSLALFIEANCIKTQFEADAILVEQFKERYNHFCESNRLNPTNITRTLMATHGIETEKLQLTYVQRKPLTTLRKQANGKKIKLYSLEIEKADRQINRMIQNMISKQESQEVLNQIKQPQIGGGGVMTQNAPFQPHAAIERSNPLTQNWFILDLLSVVFHLIAVFFLALLPDTISMFSQISHSFYSTSSVRDIMTYHDFSETPYNITWKLFTLKWWDKMIIIFSVVFVVLAIIELLIYYCRMKFPLDTLKLFDKINASTSKNNTAAKRVKQATGCLERISQTIQWIYIFIILAIVIGYVSLILIWSILGAILNPTAYLYYAAAAGTFVTYIGVKYNQLKDLQRKGWSNILKIIQAKTNQIIDAVLKKIANATGMSDQMAKALDATVDAAISGDMSALQGAAIQFVNATPVGKKLASAGLDVGLAVRMAKGDLTAIVEFARSKGIPKPVAQALVALLQNDMNSLIEALKELVSGDPLKLPPELVDIVVELILRPTNTSSRTVANTLAHTFYTILDEHLEIDMPNFEVCKVIFPLFFQAISQIIEGDLDGFLDIVTEINENLLSSCEKKLFSQKGMNLQRIKSKPQNQLQNQRSIISVDAGKANSDFFNDSGNPNFALPRHFLSMLELFKIPLNTLGLVQLNKNRLKRALCDTLNSFAFVDRDILDFLIITFTDSHTRIHSVNRSGKILTRQDQMQIVKQVSRQLDLNEFIMKTIFKIMNCDKNFDEYYFDEVNDACRRMFRKHGENQREQYLHRDFVEIAYGIFTILNTNNVKKSLVKTAEEFGIDRHTSQAMLRISSKIEFSGESWRKFMATDIIALSSKQLRIGKRDVAGVISLLMGDLSNPYTENIIRSFCNRNNLPEKLIPILHALLNLFTSKVNSEVLESITILGLQKFQSLIMIGKKMLHPKYVDENDFRSFGIEKGEGNDKSLLGDRQKLTMDQNVLNSWIKRLSVSLLRVRPRKGGKGANFGPEPSNINLEEIPEAKQEEKGGIYQNLDVYQQDAAKEAQAAPPVSLPPLVKKNSRLSAVIGKAPRRQSIASSTNVKLQFNEAQLMFAEKMLSIDQISISVDILKALIEHCTNAQRIAMRPLRLSDYELITKFFSIKDIIFRTSRQAMNLAINNFVNLLGFNKRIFSALVDIATTDAQSGEGKLDLALNEIYSKRSESSGGSSGFESSQNQNLANFAKFATEQLSSISKSERVIDLLAHSLGFPKSFIAGFLTPHLSDALLVSVNDICYMFDIAGFHDHNFDKKHLKLKNQNVSLSRLKFVLANLNVGHIPNISEVMKIFGIRGKLGEILQSLCTTRQQNKIMTMFKLFRQLLSGQNLPKRVIQMILAIFALLKGYPSDFVFEFEESDQQRDKRQEQLKLAKEEQNFEQILKLKHPPQATAVPFLAKTFGTYPQYFESLHTIVSGDHKRLPELLANLAYKAQELGVPLIEPQLIPGLLSLAAGKIYSTQDLAERLNVSPDLVDVCIQISAISKGKVGKQIMALSYSNAFSRFTKHLKINKDAFLNLLRLSFNQVKSNEIAQVFGALHLHEHCEVQYLKAIMAISRGSNNFDLFDVQEPDLAFKVRREHVQELEKNIPALCKPFGIPPQLAIVNVRLRQGDFLIIQDFKDYLMPLMKGEKTLEVAMGICGLLRCPIKYHNKLGAYPKQATYGGNFEGALEYMASSLGLNPIIFRLCTFDEQTLDYVQSKYKIPRQIVIAFIVSLANLGTEISDVLLEKDLYRNAYIMKETNNLQKKELQKKEEEKLKKKQMKQESKKKKQQKLNKNAFRLIIRKLYGKKKRAEKEEKRRLKQQQKQKEREQKRAEKEKKSKLKKGKTKKSNMVDNYFNDDDEGMNEDDDESGFGNAGSGAPQDLDDEMGSEQEFKAPKPKKKSKQLSEEGSNFDDDMQQSEVENSFGSEQEEDDEEEEEEDYQEQEYDQDEQQQEEQYSDDEYDEDQSDYDEDDDDMYSDQYDSEYDDDDDDDDYDSDQDSQYEQIDDEDDDEDNEEIKFREGDDAELNQDFDHFNTHYDQINFEQTMYEIWYREIIKAANIDLPKFNRDQPGKEKAGMKRNNDGDSNDDDDDYDNEDDNAQEEPDQDKYKDDKYYPVDDQAEFNPNEQVIECVMFNQSSWMCYEYSKLLRDDKQIKNFNMDKAEIKKLLGTRQDWDKAIASTFFKDPNDPYIWEEQEVSDQEEEDDDFADEDDMDEMAILNKQKKSAGKVFSNIGGGGGVLGGLGKKAPAPPPKGGLFKGIGGKGGLPIPGKSQPEPPKQKEKLFVGFEKYNWLRKGDRKYIHNIWGIFKKFLRDLSKDMKVTNSQAHEYDRIWLTQFIFAISILDVRKRLDSKQWNGKMNDHCKLIVAFEQMFSWIERNTIMSGKLGIEFFPNRVLKILGMATNIRISNYFDYFNNWRAQFFKKQNFKQFKKPPFKSVAQIQKANEDYSSYLDDLRQKQKIYGMLMYEVEQFLMVPQTDQENMDIFRDTYIQDSRTARDYWPQSMPRFKYQPTKWKKQIGTAVDFELCQKLMVIPQEIDQAYNELLNLGEQDIKQKKTVIDFRSGLQITKVYSFFEQLQRFLIAEHEPMAFMVGLADTNDEIWNQFKEELKRVKIIKTEASLQMYKSVQSLINLKRKTKQYSLAKQKVAEGETVNPPDLKPVLNCLTSGLGIDPLLVEDLIMLSQGNLEKIHFTNLTNRFNLPPNLVETFFLNAFLPKLKSQAEIMNFIKPLTRLLGVDSRIVFAIISIINYRPIGWEILGVNLCKKKVSINQQIPPARANMAMKYKNVEVDAYQMISKVIKLVDWRKLKYQQEQKSLSSEQLKLAKEDYLVRILEIVDMLDGQGSKKHIKNVTLMEIIKLLHNILLGDLPKVIQSFKTLEPVLRINSDKEIEMFTAVCLMTGEVTNLGKNKQALVKDSCDKFAKWLSDQIISKGEPKKEAKKADITKQQNLAKGLVKFLFGNTYEDYKMMDSGVKLIGGKFENTYWILRTLESVKWFKKIKLNDIMNHQTAGDPIWRSFIFISRLLFQNYEALKKQVQRVKKDDKNNKNEDAFLFKSSHNLPSFICMKWEDMEQSETNFTQKFSQFLTTKCIEEDEKKLKKILRKNQGQWSELDNFSKKYYYEEFMTSIMCGNVSAFLKFMGEHAINRNDIKEQDNQIIRTIEFAKYVYAVMQMSQKNVQGAVKELYKKDLSGEESKDQEEDQQQPADDINEEDDLKHEDNDFDDQQDEDQDGFASPKSPKKKEEKKKKPQKTKSQEINADHIKNFTNQLSILNVMHFQNKIAKVQKQLEINQNNESLLTLKRDSEFAIELFKDTRLFNFTTTALLAMKYDLLNQQYITTLLMNLIDFIIEKSDINENVKLYFEKIIEVFFGRRKEDVLSFKQDAQVFTFQERTQKLVVVVLNLFLPDLKHAEGFFRKLVNVIFQLLNSKSIAQFGNILLEIAKDLGDLFGANPVIINGLIGIINGDYQALAQMAAPIAKIDPQTIRRTVQFLEQVKDAMFDHQDKIQEQKAGKKGGKEFKGDRWRDVMNKIASGKATYRQLFDMVDAEGDGSGGISKQQFSMLLKRLRMKFSEHRIDEIFTSVQKKVSGDHDDNPNELNEREFEQAMKYVEGKTADSTLQLLGLSTSQLIAIFIGLTTILLLLFVFIFLGVSALSIAGGGAFGSIINSLLPIGAGAAVGQKKQVNEEEEQKKTQDSVQEVEQILKTEE